MRKIKIYAISKKQNKLIGEFTKNITRFGVFVDVMNIFNNKINEAQRISPQHAKTAYSNEFNKYIKDNVFNIALDVHGKEVDSYEFSNLIRDKEEVSFFIGGAFGFEVSFLSKMNTISLSKMTFSHNIAQIVLYEQIYRALCIINNHPYHKI